MIDKYGEEMVVQGFTGDRVAPALWKSRASTSW